MDTVTLKPNGPMYFIIFAVLLIIVVVFTKEGNEAFIMISSWFGIFSEEVLLVVVVLLIVMMLINTYNIDMNLDTNGTRKLVREVTVEGFEGSQSFCDKYQNNPHTLHKKCQQFNEQSCNAPDCCVWINSERCVGGNKFGPTFYSDEDKNDIEIDHFHHKGQCRGNCLGQEEVINE